jgi:signal transduction histidine kinase
MKIFFAQDTIPSVPWSTTSNWILGAIGFLGIVTLVLGVINQSRKLWGRKPPIDEEFANLGESLAKRENTLRFDIQAGDERLEQLMNELRAEVEFKYDTLVNERQRQSKDLHDKIDTRFMHMMEKMEEVKGELLVAGQRRGREIHDRINDVSELVARVDERTKI